MVVNYKKLCKKCKKYFVPYKGPHSRYGICLECRVDSGKCKAITETGYQCESKAEIFGYCNWHFLNEPIKKLIKDVKKIK